MKGKSILRVVGLASLTVFMFTPRILFAQGTTQFTYQGYLTVGSQPANGPFDMVVTLVLGGYQYPGGPPNETNYLATLTNSDVMVSNGVFTTALDFGAGVFNGSPAWLQFSVRTNGGGAFTTLAPFQFITPTPYAILANTASNVSGTVSVAQLNGTVANGQLANSSITVTAGTGLSGGGLVSLGSSTTINNAGVTALAGTGDISVSAPNGAVVVRDNGTNGDVPDSLVTRDAGGDFSANNINLDGALYLPYPAEIYAGGANVFEEAGNLTLGLHNVHPLLGAHNVRLGAYSLDSGNTGSFLTAVGEDTLFANTTGSNDTANGYQALDSNTIGADNTAIGFQALFNNTAGVENTAVGSLALRLNTGTDNTAVGYDAMYANSSGLFNTAVGDSALSSNLSGQNNTALGHLALSCPDSVPQDNTAVGAATFTSLVNGDNDIAVGVDAGGDLVTGSYNIYIGNNDGVDEDRTIRMGEEAVQTNTYIAGIYGASPPNSLPVIINSSGQLGTEGSIPNNQLQNNTVTIITPPGSGFGGGGPVPLGGAITLTNTGVLSIIGNGDIATTESNGTITLSDTATSAAAADTIVKRDDSGNFSAGTVTLSGGLSLPFPAILSCGGTNFLLEEGSLYMGFQNSTYAVQANLYNTAFGDYSLGVEAVTTNVSGNYNSAIGEYALGLNYSGSFNTASGAYALYTNSSGSYNTASGYSALESNSSGNNNTANGAFALLSNTTGTNNTASGFQALESNIIGNGNAAFGYLALQADTTSGNNTALGARALESNNAANNTASGHAAMENNQTGGNNTADGVQALQVNLNGNNNTAVGVNALEFNTNGNNNIALGYIAGQNLVTGGSNIDIGNTGVNNENGAIRIGQSPDNTSAYIAGIYGSTAASGVAVYVNSSGQLGTLTSSAKYKQDIQNMGDASDALLKLRPVTFQYKPDLDPQSIPQFGLVAEDVEKVDPSLVVHDEQHGIYTVRYQAVDAMLLNEFLKEHKLVEAQEAEIDTLEERLNQLEQTVQSLSQKQ